MPDDDAALKRACLPRGCLSPAAIWAGYPDTSNELGDRIRRAGDYERLTITECSEHLFWVREYRELIIQAATNGNIDGAIQIEGEWTFLVPAIFHFLDSIGALPPLSFEAAK